MGRFRRAEPAGDNSPQHDRRELDSGGWVDLAKCEKLWSYNGPRHLSFRGEALWRSPQGDLVMRWARHYRLRSHMGLIVERHVDEWAFDAVEPEFVKELLLKRDAEGFDGQGKIIAHRLVPHLFPSADWDPELER